MVLPLGEDGDAELRNARNNKREALATVEQAEPHLAPVPASTSRFGPIFKTMPKTTDNCIQCSCTTLSKHQQNTHLHPINTPFG
ncbi:hypothetical protein PIB30_059035 [Stylosanthes scabra]|uniref:Uncharacterized protein n=1 Tax=Stylosanthes scabra TaxID=79078 RepID=A0ABU6UIX0_9FABA|nr:hypothetical protein [Stylosanthes scabra]